MKPFGRRNRRDPLAGLPPELQRVLDAAAAPAHASELEGLAAATAAFTSTSLEPAVSWNFAKLIATPVAALVAVTGLGGGVALAAATGSLPDAAQRVAARLGAPAPDGETQRSATATANLTKTNRGRCVAVTMGNKPTPLPAPLAAAAAATDCPTAKPGDNRSETATARLADKPSKAPKPSKSAKPAGKGKPATTGRSATPRTPDSATAEQPRTPGKPDSAGQPESAPAGRPETAGKPAR